MEQVRAAVSKLAVRFLLVLKLFIWKALKFLPSLTSSSEPTGLRKEVPLLLRDLEWREASLAALTALYATEIIRWLFPLGLDLVLWNESLFETDTVSS